MDEKCPTENHIIGTALKVLKKEVLPTTCGVKVSTWHLGDEVFRVLLGHGGCRCPIFFAHHKIIVEHSFGF